MSYDKVSLLLPMNGANNGTVFTDWSPVLKTVTRAGNVLPVTSTARSQYYGSSGLFAANASGQHSHLRHTASTTIGTGQFTIQAWVWLENIDSFAPILETRGDSGFASTGNVATGALFYWRFDKVAWVWGVSNTRYDGTTALASGTWHHFEASRDSSDTLRVFVDGNLEITQASYTQNLSNPYWTIGGQAITGNISRARNINDFQLNIGEALHTANFTPPARLLGTIDNSAVGASKILDINGDPAERTVFAVPRVAPTRVWSDVSNASGEFEIQAPASVDHSVVALADESDSNGELLRNDIVHRVIPV